MYKKFQKLIVALILFSILSSFAIYWISVSRMNPPKPEVDEIMNEKFINLINLDTEMNSTLKLSSFDNIASNTEWETISIFVWNYGDEPIEFPNYWFDAKIYWFNELSKQWEPVELLTRPAPQINIIPAKTIEGEGRPNILSFFRHEFTYSDYPFIRVYISGIGKKTSIEYGAYIDVVFPK